MNITKITAAAVAAAALGAFAAPSAWADDAAGTSATLGEQAKLVDGNSVQGWTISGLKPSADALPYAANGTLWEATATDEALQGGATPIVSNLNARAADGQNYRVLFGVASPQGVNPAGLDQGQKTTGKVYFDVTGPAPQSVVYNDGGRDVLIWQGSSTASPAAAPTSSGTHAAAPAAARWDPCGDGHSGRHSGSAGRRPRRRCCRSTRQCCVCRHARRPRRRAGHRHAAGRWQPAQLRPRRAEPRRRTRGGFDPGRHSRRRQCSGSHRCQPGRCRRGQRAHPVTGGTGRSGGTDPCRRRSAGSRRWHRPGPGHCRPGQRRTRGELDRRWSSCRSPDVLTTQPSQNWGPVARKATGPQFVCADCRRNRIRQVFTRIFAA